MKYIDWDHSMTVGTGFLDDHHKQMINYINLLGKSIEKKESKQIIGELLQKLMNYAIFHFSEEVTYMEQISFKDISQHKKEHNFYIQSIQKFNQDWIVEKKDPTIDTHTFLLNWFIKHIMISDMKYSQPK